MMQMPTQMPNPMMPPTNKTDEPTDPRIAMPDQFIEGVGTYLCIFRGTQKGGQLVSNYTWL